MDKFTGIDEKRYLMTGQAKCVLCPDFSGSGVVAAGVGTVVVVGRMVSVGMQLLEDTTLSPFAQQIFRQCSLGAPTRAQNASALARSSQ
jgi:hypothetical protein